MKLTTLLQSSAALLVLGTIPALAQTAITDEMLANPPAGEWINYGQNQENYRHSPLTQITADNVGQLQLVWARGMEAGKIQVTPLVHDGVMYLANPGDVIQAIDAATGDLIWEHRRQLPNIATLNSFGEPTRGMALYGTNVYFVSWDNHLVALDTSTGQVVFDVDRGQGTDMVSNSSGPIVANGVIVAGSTCQYSPFGCFVSGHDSATGEELWRNTFIPRAGEEGDETWGNDYEARWMTGVWGQITYDPVGGLVHYGTSAVGPAAEIQRGTVGGSMYGTNTRFAVRPETGEIVWRHQTLPRDNWDQECTFEMMVVNVDVQPSAEMEGLHAINPDAATGERRVVTGVPCKNGTMWQFDAETGEFLWARDTSYQNLIESVDPDGLVHVNEDLVVTELEVAYEICPTFLGGRDWPSAALNPDTGIYFIPLNNACSGMTAVDQEFSSLDVYNVSLDYKLSPGSENMGRIDAIDISTGRTLWSAERYASNYAPVLSTGGGVLFNGGTDRYFRALSQETGETLWQTRLATVASGQAISYEIDGVQYVAIGGGGTSYGSNHNRALTERIDSTAIGSAIYVFALPQQ
ncbi:pyrroloquinoline quinone-dependent dehydrogenase [Ketogulonicigenium vulgare]|uniref:Precursor of SSDA3 n=1 Tax=Ketogulonicigenium vulgare (strain WSH-001) TaxID=759362 RepID=F9Y8Y6_KETVW|nr:PQQ-binding-like beta-propeller repeat protein [Ketogulonicigenium vulgare]AEM40042.1 Precursor of SSDA3 [Ketogulonicigenium vulgare WSH-001]ALJ80248.1 ATP-binding protein [Ketogulonicigenium vulgare]ANW33107.1 ATP-binding protein [Ketogulonicigenium vulgare]AOZ53742.1 sorbose dehydrogenase [Ketogulonicigenium vulgare]